MHIVFYLWIAGVIALQKIKVGRVQPRAGPGVGPEQPMAKLGVRPE